MADRRLEVLSRQLNAGSVEAPLAGELAGLCPKKLGAFLVHDNPELRASIFEFLKVR
jgi:hypothetical protein